MAASTKMTTRSLDKATAKNVNDLVSYQTIKGNYDKFCDDILSKQSFTHFITLLQECAIQITQHKQKLESFILVHLMLFDMVEASFLQSFYDLKLKNIGNKSDLLGTLPHFSFQAEKDFKIKINSVFEKVSMVVDKSLQHFDLSSSVTQFFYRMRLVPIKEVKKYITYLNRNESIVSNWEKTGNLDDILIRTKSEDKFNLDDVFSELNQYIIDFHNCTDTTTVWRWPPSKYWDYQLKLNQCLQLINGIDSSSMLFQSTSKQGCKTGPYFIEQDTLFFLCGRLFAGKESDAKRHDFVYELRKNKTYIVLNKDHVEYLNPACYLSKCSIAKRRGKGHVSVNLLTKITSLTKSQGASVNFGIFNNKNVLFSNTEISLLYDERFMLNVNLKELEEISKDNPLITSSINMVFNKSCMYFNCSDDRNLYIVQEEENRVQEERIHYDSMAVTSSTTKKRSKISKVKEESVQEESENEDEDSTNKVVTKKQKLQNIEVVSKRVKRSRQDNLSIDGDCIDNYLINVQTPIVVKQTTISYGCYKICVQDQFQTEILFTDETINTFRRTKYNTTPFTDIFAIIGLDQTYIELINLINSKAEMFANLKTFTLLAYGDLKQFTLNMLYRLNASSLTWKKFINLQFCYGDSDDVRHLITFVHESKYEELKQFDRASYTNINEEVLDHIKSFVTSEFNIIDSTFSVPLKNHVIETLLKHLNINDGCYCLDFGCGVPKLAFALGHASKLMAVAMDFTDVIKPIIDKCELASKNTTTNYTKITWDTTSVVTDDPTLKKAKKIIDEDFVFNLDLVTNDKDSQETIENSFDDSVSKKDSTSSESKTKSTPTTPSSSTQRLSATGSSSSSSLLSSPTLKSALKKHLQLKTSELDNDNKSVADSIVSKKLNFNIDKNAYDDDDHDKTNKVPESSMEVDNNNQINDPDSVQFIKETNDSTPWPMLNYDKDMIPIKVKIDYKMKFSSSYIGGFLVNGNAFNEDFIEPNNSKNEVTDEETTQILFTYFILGNLSVYCDILNNIYTTNSKHGTNLAGYQLLAFEYDRHTLTIIKDDLMYLATDSKMRSQLSIIFPNYCKDKQLVLVTIHGRNYCFQYDPCYAFIFAITAYLNLEGINLEDCTNENIKNALMLYECPIFKFYISNKLGNFTSILPNGFCGYMMRYLKEKQGVITSEKDGKVFKKTAPYIDLKTNIDGLVDFKNFLKNPPVNVEKPDKWGKALEFLEQRTTKKGKVIRKDCPTLEKENWYDLVSDSALFTPVDSDSRILTFFDFDNEKFPEYAMLTIYSDVFIHNTKFDLDSLYKIAEEVHNFIYYDKSHFYFIDKPEILIELKDDINETITTMLNTLATEIVCVGHHIISIAK